MSEGWWYAEPPTRGYEQRYEIRGRVYEGQSAYQRVAVLDSVPFGRMLTLDDIAQTSEADEHIYHEMLVHVPMFQHPDPRRVLVIGGGDGGTLRRVLEHPIEHVLMVELDDLVVSASREHLPSISRGAFDDPRAALLIGDGAAYLRDTHERFDVILVDSTDPIGAAEVLFSEPFFQSARRALNPGGLYAMQSGSPLLQTSEMAGAVRGLRAVFSDARPYLASVPLYPGILWSFTMATREGEIAAVDAAAIRARLAAASIRVGCYTPELHAAAFALPGFISAILDGGGRDPSRHPLPGG